MNTSVLIFNFVRKKRKFVKSRRKEKRLVFSSTEFSINLPKCKPSLKGLMTTSILSRDIELKLKDSMKLFRDNMKAKRKKLMISLKEFSRPKRSSINSTEL
jgi:hypothetical protein